MCGRIAQFFLPHDLERVLGVPGIVRTVPFIRYNVAPTELVEVVELNHGGLGSGPESWVMTTNVWGHQFPSGQSGKRAPFLLNAQAEKLGGRFWGHPDWLRCLVPVSGFFEWKKEGENQGPFFIRRLDRMPMLLGGLQRSLDTGAGFARRMVIVTTAPSRWMAPIHNRMPAIVENNQTAWRTWLGNDTSAAHSLAVPYQTDDLEAVPVSTYVNSAKNKEERCINRVRRP